MGFSLKAEIYNGNVISHSSSNKNGKTMAKTMAMSSVIVVVIRMEKKIRVTKCFTTWKLSDRYSRVHYIILSTSTENF